jgi:hypothetical protein
VRLGLARLRELPAVRLALASRPQMPSLLGLPEAVILALGRGCQTLAAVV